MYEYNWIYTIAQIELMNIDAPLTCYKEHKDPNKQPTRKELNDTVNRWKERKKKRKWKMMDLLNKGKKENSDEAQQQ